MQSRKKIRELVGICFMLLASLGVFPVYGSGTENILSIQQHAEWTDELQIKGNISIEITGLDAYINEIKNEVSKVQEKIGEENKEEEAKQKENEQSSESLILNRNLMEEESIETEAEQESIPLQPSFSLIYYLSEYFKPDMENMPQEYIAEEMTFTDEDGNEVNGTKLSIPITIGEGSDLSLIHITIPILLKEEYHFLGSAQAFPVNRDVPCQEIQGHGIYLIRSDTMDILSMTNGINLEKKETEIGFQMYVQPDQKNIKEGQTVTYEVILENTGEIPLNHISIQNQFSKEGLYISWQQEEGLTVLENGKGAVLDVLEKGDKKALYARVEVPEGVQENFTNTFYVSCQNPIIPESVIENQAQIFTSVTALRVEYTVEKTADRLEAVPGDTVRYQICIRNTGERTLHSVLSTERFLSSGIQAQFLEKEGVKLNPEKNQALIPQILPGEAFALEAIVTLPINLTNQELINQVTVTTKETGEKMIQSQARIQVQMLTATPTPYQIITPTSIQTGASYKSGESYAKQVSSSPKTGDDSCPIFWMGLIGIATGVFIVSFCIWKGKRKH